MEETSNYSFAVACLGVIIPPPLFGEGRMPSKDIHGVEEEPRSRRVAHRWETWSSELFQEAAACFDCFSVVIAETEF